MMAAAVVGIVVQVAQPAPVRGRVVDGGTGAPIALATVQGARARSTSDAEGAFAIAAVTGDTLRVRRVGYRATIAVVGSLQPIVVRLVPAAIPLGAVRVRDTAVVARTSATVTSDDLRLRGASTLADGLRTLPFVAARGARGQSVVSMRGARPEQVVVTIDGVPINDPASGIADLADVPLASLAAVTVTPGADAARFGSGASGGVLALTTGGGTLASLSSGSYGRRSADAAGSLDVGAGTVRAGASWSTARNDFPFVNREGATGSDSVEHRVNADERRATLFASAVMPRVQLLALASTSERGMAGPMNVRAYDDDRGATHRGVLRALAPLGAATVDASVRAFGTSYRDPRAASNDYRASSLSADVELAGALGPLALRAGVGGDRASGTTIDAPVRERAFASAAHTAQLGRFRIAAAARVDGIDDAGVQLSPSLAVERALGAASNVTTFARVAQAFRAPTLNDVYFAGAQRLIARALAPERVTLDAELGARVSHARARASASVFERRTRDAIVWFPGNFGWSASNVGRERVRGAESRVDVSFAHASLGAWGAVYEARLTADRLVIPTPYVPSAAGGAVGTLRLGRSSFTATMQATGRRAYGSGVASREYELPSVALLSLNLAHELALFDARALVSLGVDNATDVEWQSVRFYPMPGRTWSAAFTLTP